MSLPGKTARVRDQNPSETRGQHPKYFIPTAPRDRVPRTMLALAPRASGYGKRQSEPSATAPTPKIHPSPSQSQQEWIPASPPAPGGDKLASYVRKRPGTALPRAARALPLKGRRRLERIEGWKRGEGLRARLCTEENAAVSPLNAL